MKRSVSLLLALATVCVLSAFSVQGVDAEKKLQFHADGTFRILQINDFQDTHETNWMSLNFLDVVLDKYKPDLVVMVGDQLKNSYPEPTADKLKRSLDHQLSLLEKRGVPFIYTFGNHDHDLDYILSPQEQAAFYDSYSMSYAVHNGPDPGTYNSVVYGSDGKTPMLNIYMMDTHNWSESGVESGVNREQVQWYKQTGNALKAQNGGKVLPSLLFQHIPVKEVYSLLREVPEGTPGCVNTPFGDQHYVLDEGKMVGDYNVMHEGVYSEAITKTTGQYEAWVEQGDLIGAYFGHDHANTFVGKTDDGIVMGYCGGFGYACYGDGKERYARVYDFRESDVTEYTRTTIPCRKTVSVFDLVRLLPVRIWDVLRDQFHVLFKH